jgi:hypothetical protein
MSNSDVASGSGGSDGNRPSGGRPARVSLFDLRWILAFLFGVYGIVVTLMGLLSHASTFTASGQDVGVNVNLWTGIPMLVLAALFALWAALRPAFVPSSDDKTVGRPDD